jgi:diguanylate cyclase (GGDEF)-like protein/PAS domain S-box-containing protein
LETAVGGPGDVLDQRVQTARLIGRVRWAGVLLGVVQAILISNPAPVFGALGILVPAVVMAGYNVPVALMGRLPKRWVATVVMSALVGDFLVVTAWTLLTANDMFSTSYAAYGLVAIEAAVLYRWRGAIGFMAGFAVAYAGYYLLRHTAFNYSPQIGSVVYRTGIIMLTAAFIGGITTVSERRRMRYETLLEAVSDLGQGLVITESGRMIYGNAAYERITGYDAGELAALPSLIDIAADGERDVLVSRLKERLSGGSAPSQYESRVITKDGRTIDVETAIRPLRAEGTHRLIALVRDITERKRAQQTLEESERKAFIAARLDPLTGIANRRAWEEEIERAMARSRRDGSPITVALLDLDGFKAYNDDWGHIRGDELLRAYATRWREPLREVDLIARYGGDEFAVLLPGSGVDEARMVIQRLRAATGALPPFSAGLAGWDGAETGESLMARADSALYNSKRSGPGRVTVLATSHERVQSWSYLIPRLIASRELDAIYQPIRRLEDFGLVGYEALARPAGFGVHSSVEELFDTAKRLGYSRDLDWLCRRVAVHSATSLPKNALLFINVSIHALLDPNHDVDQMLLLMRWAGRDPGTVIFEISERDQIADLERLRGVLSAYREEGFRFALDDVGEGHSTLEVLTGANPEYIKIARSLSVGVESPGPRSAVQALVTFAASSGAKLVAEGLETNQHIELVRQLGIELGQGYGVSAPRSVEQLSDAADNQPIQLRAIS